MTAAMTEVAVLGLNNPASAHPVTGGEATRFLAAMIKVREAHGWKG